MRNEDSSRNSLTLSLNRLVLPLVVHPHAASGGREHTFSSSIHEVCILPGLTRRREAMRKTESGSLTTFLGKYVPFVGREQEAAASSSFTRLFNGSLVSSPLPQRGARADVSGRACWPARNIDKGEASVRCTLRRHDSPRPGKRNQRFWRVVPLKNIGKLYT